MKTQPWPPAPGPQSLIANAILGIDTLWGGDVICPSGTGRFIADSWFSHEPYTDPTAAKVRGRLPERCGGII